MLDILEADPRRPAGDILSRVVRVVLGGREYQLPVRSIKGNREWLEQLGAATIDVASQIDRADSGARAAADLYAALIAQAPALLDALIAYDTAGVLPSKDEIEAIEPDCTHEIVAAVGEVWRAANPLVVTALRNLAAIQESGSSERTSSPATPTAGPRRRSRKN